MLESLSTSAQVWHQHVMPHRPLATRLLVGLGFELDHLAQPADGRVALQQPRQLRVRWHLQQLVIFFPVCSNPLKLKQAAVPAHHILRHRMHIQVLV